MKHSPEVHGLVHAARKAEEERGEQDRFTQRGFSVCPVPDASAPSQNAAFTHLQFSSLAALAPRHATSWKLPRSGRRESSRFLIFITALAGTWISRWTALSKKTPPGPRAARAARAAGAGPAGPEEARGAARGSPRGGARGAHAEARRLVLHRHAELRARAQHVGNDRFREYADWFGLSKFVLGFPQSYIRRGYSICARGDISRTRRLLRIH